MQDRKLDFIMFKLFKRTKIAPWELKLILNTIQLLPTEYQYLKKQLYSGLFKGVLIGLSDLPGYVCFTYHPKIAKQFENIRDQNYQLTDIKVFDIKSNSYLLYSIYVSTGRINGYSIVGAKNFVIDLNNINVQEFKKVYKTNGDFRKIEPYLTSLEKQKINPGEVYEVKLNDKMLFHIKDLEDGDFIGVD